MFRFFLFLKGYFLLEISSYGAERFINLCKLKDIYLWDLKSHGGKYLMKIKMSDFNMLEEIIHKTDVKVDILKKYGLPFFFHKKNNRIMYLIFLILAISIIFISNLFIWKIEFYGNYTVTKEQLEDFLKENNVSIGSLKSGIEYEKIEKELRKQYSIIKWCSVAIKGNSLYISIEENALLDNKVTENHKDSYSDIVACADGIVDQIMVRNGLALVNVGDNVTKGQVLVTGAVPIYDDSMTVKKYHYYEADADILLKTTVNYLEEIEEGYIEKEYTGRTKSFRYLKMGSLDLHLPFRLSYAYYDIYTSSRQLILFDTVKIPVYYGEYEAREYYIVEKKYTREEIVEIANKKLGIYYETLSQKGVQILQKDVKIEHNADKWVINGNYVVYKTEMENVDNKLMENSIQ